MTHTPIPHVLLVAPNTLGSSSFYITRPLAALARRSQLTFRMEAESQVDIAEVRASDIVLFCRNIEPEYDWILQECLSRGIPTVYHLDDNLWEVPPGYYYTDYYRAPQRLQQLERYLSLANQVHVYNTLMRDRALEYNPNVVQLLSTIDLRLLPQQLPPRKDERIRITYVTSRGAVDPLVRLFGDDLQRLLDTYPGLFEVTWWGEAPERFRDHPSTRVVDLVHDYEHFLRLLATEGFEIGLAPLLPTAFHLSKTNTKFRDYGACHIAGLYSEVPVYTDCVKHGYTGLIVPNQSGAWFEALNQLVTNPYLRQNIRQAAYQEVDAYYRQEIAEQQWSDVLAQLVREPRLYAGVALVQARQELSDAVEQASTRLADQKNHIWRGEAQLAVAQGELELQLPLARQLANTLEAYRSRRLLRLVEGLRDRTDYAQRLGPGFTRLLDDSRLFGLAARGFRLRPSTDLSRQPCRNYRLPVPRPGLRRVHLALLFDLYPGRGRLRLELAALDGRIIAHSQVPAASIPGGQPATFAFDPLPAPGLFELRLYAQDLDVPLRVYEWQQPTRLGLGRPRTRPFCAMDFYSPA